MSNKNCTNVDSCDSCESCESCDSCYSCDFCNFCYSCNFCYFCNSCDSCNSCNFCYSCDFSANLRMSERMIFCLGNSDNRIIGEGYLKNNRIFNVEVTPDVFDKYKNHPKFELPVAKWVKYKDLSNDEQTSTAKQLDGLLKTLSYKDAWAEAWPKASDEFKKWVTSLPNFNADLFEKITGQRIDAPTSLVGKEVEVKLDGKTYKAKIVEG